MPGAHAEAVVSPASIPGMDGAATVSPTAIVMPDVTVADREVGDRFLPAVALHAVPSYRHQKACLRLRDVLVAQLGERAVVTVGVGWLLPEAAGGTVRVPDLLVLLDEPVADVVTSAPLIVVEVLSGDRADDLVLKSPEYLAAGVEQYWILDPRDRVLDLFGRGVAGWDRIGRLTDEMGELVVAVPELGLVSLPGPAVLG